MSLQRLLRYQHCVHWPLLGRQTTGPPTYSAPQELLCRWVEETGLLTNASGETLQFKTKVYLMDDIAPDDALMLGSMDLVTNFTDPFANGLVYRVIDFRKNPGPRNRQTLRIAYL